MSDLVLETPEGVPLRFEIAGAGTRLLAAVLDGLLWSFTMIALTLTAGLIGLGGFLLLSGGILWLVLYWFLFSLLWSGRTPGKRVLGIRVTDEQGFPARASQHFLRCLFVPLEAVVAVPIPLVWILIAGTPRHQRLGDLVAGTLVLRERVPPAPPEPAPRAVWSRLESRSLALGPADARAVEGRELGFLRRLLARTDLEPRARERLTLRAARHFERRLGLERRATSPREARAFLRELFLFLRELRAPAGAQRSDEGLRNRPR